MRQTTLLAGTAGLTLVVLVGAFLAFRAITGPEAGVASPSPTASVADEEPSASPSPSPTPLPSATATALPSATATPVPTPVKTAAPTAIPGETVTYIVKGSAYVDSEVPDGGKITNLANGAISMTTGNLNSEELTVTYRLVIPAGRVVKSYKLNVCGTGSGNFWESYGPPGSDPVEYEVVPPVSGGCWPFAGSTMPDTTVLAIIGHGSQMRIDRIEYILTFR